MADSPRTDPDGFPLKELTVHILPPIYPDPAKTMRENCATMRQRNEDLWKETYERVYGVSLTFLDRES